jgi:uncharacterized protein (DUF1501 family)
MNRRLFLKGSALAALGFASPLPGVLVRAAAAAAAGDRTLVVLFLRGGADGVGIVVPYRDPTYYAARPTLGVPASGDGAVLDLDGYFGLHPALAPLLPLWKERRLGVVHATGPVWNVRSHAEAQDRLARGVSDPARAGDGWLERATGATAGRHGVGVATRAPTILAGDLGLPTASPLPDPALTDADRAALDAMYADSTDTAFAARTKATVRAILALESARDAAKAPANGATYPDTTAGAGLRLVASLVRTGPPPQVAYIEAEGWDHHSGAREKIATRLDGLGRALAAFAQDLGDRLRDVMVVTVTEFGRSVAENPAGGTDHGAASCSFVLGGRIKGGQVHGNWPGIAAEDRVDGGLRVTTDWRDVLTELLRGHLGLADIGPVFPEFTERPDHLELLNRT